VGRSFTVENGLVPLKEDHEEMLHTHTLTHTDTHTHTLGVTVETVGCQEAREVTAPKEGDEEPNQVIKDRRLPVRTHSFSQNVPGRQNETPPPAQGANQQTSS